MLKISRLIFAIINRDKIKQELACEFDSSFYKSTYCSDLPSWIDPVDHYLVVGLWNGYDPSPHFSGSQYISTLSGVVFKTDRDTPNHDLRTDRLLAGHDRFGIDADSEKGGEGVVEQVLWYSWTAARAD